MPNSLKTLLAAAAATLALPVQAQDPAQTLDLEPCRIDAGPGFDTAKALCASLARPENPEAPDGRSIELAIAVIPALNVEALPDPLVLLAGGPGQSAIDSYLQVGGAFENIRRDRPILLVDQRGTGRSNKLDCPQPSDPMADMWGGDVEAIRAFSQTCIDALDADLRFYTTSVAIDDLDAVRAALGYEQLNLWGGSYGSRVALAYMRRYPQHTRSAIIDGVVPGDELLGPALATDAQDSLDKLFNRCTESESCSAAFPNLPADFDGLRAALAESPVTLTVAHPQTGAMREQTINDSMLAAVVRMSSYSPATRALMPLMISEAAQGRFDMLASQASLIETQFDGLLALGMHNSVVCSEDAPLYADANFDREALAKTYLGEVQIDGLNAMCDGWPRGPVDPDNGKAIVSDVPTLVLSGEFDPVTPPENGDKAAKTLSVSRHIVAPGQGHIVSATGCVPRLLGEFVNSLDPEALDPACVDRLGPTPFFVSTIGPTP
ncbi:MAG: alpha/beta hydrolase [Pseudomonadota bacterium]